MKQEIAQYICIDTHTAADGTMGISYNTGTGTRCTEGNESIPGIAAILADAQPLLLGIEPEDVGFTYDPALPLDSLQRKLQHAYLSTDLFVRPIVRRLTKQLAAKGIVCSDCPVHTERPVRIIAVAEFLPYLVAYAWPDDVHTPIDSNGNPAESMRYTFHVCVGINGVAQTIPNPDPYLAYLAYTVAINSEKFIRLAHEHFRDVLEEEHFRQLVADTAQTRYLRQHLAERLRKDKRLVALAKRFLEKYSDDLMVRLE